MPKLGEGVIEATVIGWLKKEGDNILEDETIIEIATDKVDTEIQSPVSGTIKKVLYPKDSVVPVGEVIAIIETSDDIDNEDEIGDSIQHIEASEEVLTDKGDSIKYRNSDSSISDTGDTRLTPLVRNIIRSKNLSNDEISKIKGTGIRGKITKRDVLSYLDVKENKEKGVKIEQNKPKTTPVYTSQDGEYEVVEMDRMRKLIAEHMVESKRISPHVTSTVETDLTDVVKWRESIKNQFLSKYNQKITYLPIVVDAVVKAIRDFPMINSSVDGDKILVKKNINIGIATALPNGNLIVPVLKNADQYNLVGLTKYVNDLTGRARENKLLPDEISGGTFTITNLGSMGNLIGTPIINQPQVAILAIGAINKKPAVLETEFGDVIAIRNKMDLSLSYDHRVVDGFLGGSFLKRISDYLEEFNVNNLI